MTYMLVLTTHSWLRWIVLGLGVAYLVLSFTGMRGGGVWTPRHGGIGKGFLHALNLQFLLGVLLLFWLSPVAGQALSDLGAAMKDPLLRFFAVEHTATMFIAVSVAHVGMARVRKAADDASRLRSAFRFQLAWLGLTFLAIPWPWLDVARPLFRGF